MIFLHIFICAWLFYWGGRNDRFKSGGTWLKRHIPGWAIRDWPVIASHVALWNYHLNSFMWSQLAVIYGVSALLYLSCFNYGYGKDNILFDGFKRPVWYVWRPVQVLPGLAIGFIYLLLA